MTQKGKSTLLQCFPKNSLAADVAKSKCLQATSRNASFCTHYFGFVNYCKLITVTLPFGYMEKTLLSCQNYRSPAQVCMPLHYNVYYSVSMLAQLSTMWMQYFFFIKWVKCENINSLISLNIFSGFPQHCCPVAVRLCSCISCFMCGVCFGSHLPAFCCI